MVRFTPTCVGTIIQNDLDLLGRYGSPPRAWGQ